MGDTGKRQGRRGRPVRFQAETAQAEELARWLYGLTQSLSARELADRYEYNKTTWARFRNGSDLIPSWLLKKVVHDQVREPVLRQQMMDKGARLLEQAEQAQAGTLSAPQEPTDAALRSRLEEAREAEHKAHRTLMAMTQLVLYLVGVNAALQARCQQLSQQADQETMSLRLRLSRLEGQLEEARRGRDEAENMRREIHLAAESYRQTLNVALDPVTVAGEVTDIQPQPLTAADCDVLLERNQEYLTQAWKKINELRAVLGLPPTGPGIVRGQTPDKAPSGADIHPPPRLSGVLGSFVLLGGYLYLLYSAGSLHLALTREPQLSTTREIFTAMEWSGFTWAGWLLILLLLGVFWFPPAEAKEYRRKFPVRVTKSFWLAMAVWAGLTSVLALETLPPWAQGTLGMVSVLPVAHMLASHLRPSTAASFVRHRMWTVLITGVALYATVWIHPPLADFEPINSWVHETAKGWN